MKLQLAIYGLSCMMLCGCVSYPNYPSSWASLESAQQDCLSIGGVYHNIGAGSRYGAPHLAPRLFQDVKDQALFKGVDRVEVAVIKDGTLEVTALNQDWPLRSKKYFATKDEYRCNDGKIEIAHFAVDLSGARREWVILSKSIDGTLVVEDGALGMMIFILPVAGFEWLRFKPYVSGKPESQPPQVDDFVNCVAGGERRWTYRSKCD